MSLSRPLKSVEVGSIQVNSVGFGRIRRSSPELRSRQMNYFIDWLINLINQLNQVGNFDDLMS